MIKLKSLISEDIVSGGLSDEMSLSDIAKKHNVPVEDITKEFEMGMKVEMEHTTDKEVAKEIARDHLFEDPKYYTKLATIETNENYFPPEVSSKQHLVRYLYKNWKEDFPMFNSKEIKVFEKLLSATPNMEKAEMLVKDVKEKKSLQDSIKQLSKNNVFELKNEDLRKWFGKGKTGSTSGGGWDRYNSEGEKIGKCGDAKEGEPYSACLSKEKAEKLGPEGRAAFVRRKRAAQKKAGDAKKGGEQKKGQKPTFVKTGA